MSKHPLYDMAVSEVRGEASDKEKLILQADVDDWRDALQSVVDEVDAQLIIETDKFEDATRNLTPSSTDYRVAQEAFDAWKSRVRIFKKHISARLIAVKRMCQEEAEGDLSSGTLTARVVTAATALCDADSSSDPTVWDTALDNLFTAVEELRNSRT